MKPLRRKICTHTTTEISLLASPSLHSAEKMLDRQCSWNHPGQTLFRQKVACKEAEKAMNLQPPKVEMASMKKLQHPSNRETNRNPLLRCSQRSRSRRIASIAVPLPQIIASNFWSPMPPLCTFLYFVLIRFLYKLKSISSGRGEQDK